MTATVEPGSDAPDPADSAWAGSDGRAPSPDDRQPHEAAAIVGGTPGAGRTRLTATGVVGTAVAALGFVVARALESRAATLLVLAGLLVVGVAVASTRAKASVRAVRADVPGRMRVGQTAEVTLELSSPRPTGAVLVRELVPDGLGEDVTVALGGLGTTPQTRSYRIAPRRRGVYTLGPAEVISGDPFGISERRDPISTTTEVIVHPPTEEASDRVLARRWEDPPLRPPNSRPWPSGFELYGMRDYAPGDDPRRIVWRATARTGRLLVRESEQGITDRILVVVDPDRRRVATVGDDDTFETAIRVAAALGVRAIDDGFSVGLATGATAIADGLRGPGARIAYLDELARLEATGGGLVDCGPAMLAAAARGAHLLVCSTRLDNDAAALLALCIQRGSSVTFVQCVGEDPEPNTPIRAAGIGCEVARMPVGSSVGSTVSHLLGGAIR